MVNSSFMIPLFGQEQTEEKPCTGMSGTKEEEVAVNTRAQYLDICIFGR